MILTVTLNPCLHKFVEFRGPLDGRVVIRPVESHYQGGGKGINAARVIRRLGAEVTALTFAGGAIGDLFLEVVRAEGIQLDVVRTQRPTRMSTMVYGSESGQFREFLEVGAAVEDDERSAIAARFAALIPNASLVTLNGSVPDSRLDSFFAEAIEVARSHRKRSIVDTYGKALPLAAKARPWLLKANLDEVRDSFAIDVARLENVDSFARAQIEAGIGHVLITDGAAGARLYCAAGTYAFTPPTVREVNPVGSGDAMLGVLALEIARGTDIVTAARRATAAGTANAERLGLCDFPRERLDELAAQVKIKPT
jgi:tagatose 6-phosphate kinase